MLPPAGGPPARPLDGHDAFLLDLDGVLFRSGVVVPGAPETVAAVRRVAPVRFVTNNALRTPEQVADHLRRLGIGADAPEVATAAQVAVGLLVARVGPGAGRPVLVLGGDGLRLAVTDAGFTPVGSADAEPVAVVQGFAPSTAWADLAEAAYALQRGVPWVAANLDTTLPTDRGVAPGNGALVAALATATGRQPESAGKPQPTLLEAALTGLVVRRPLMVGDRLDTDVGAATAAGIPAALVLTGISTPLAVCRAPAGLRPAYLLDDVAGLLAAHQWPAMQPAGTGAACATGAGWRLEVGAGAMHFGGSGPAIEGLRAVAVAAWWAADRGAAVAEEALAAAVEAVSRQG